jgi:hypothetical protein
MRPRRASVLRVDRVHLGKIRNAQGTSAEASGDGLAYPSLSRIDFDGDFDGSCALTGLGQGAWTEDLTNRDFTGGLTALDQTTVGEGACSARFTNSASTTMTRSELTRSATGSNPEFLFEGLWYIPAATGFDGNASILQLKGNHLPDGTGDCYRGGLRIDGPTDLLSLVTVFECTSRQADGQQVFPIGPVIHDRWFAVKVYWKAGDSSSSGAARVWLDADGPGPLAYEEKVPLTSMDNETLPDQKTFLRIGQYRQPSDHESTVYADGLHLECIARC